MRYHSHNDMLPNSMYSISKCPWINNCMQLQIRYKTKVSPILRYKKLSLCTSQRHTWNGGREPFILSSQYGWVVSFIPSAALPPGKEDLYWLNKRLGGPQNQSACFAEGLQISHPSRESKYNYSHIQTRTQSLHWQCNSGCHFTLCYTVPVLQDLATL